MVKRLPTMWETWVQSLGQEDLLEKEMATHSSVLARKIPWTEEPGRLQSMGSQRIGHDWATSLSFRHIAFYLHSLYFLFSTSPNLKIANIFGGEGRCFYPVLVTRIRLKTPWGQDCFYTELYANAWLSACILWAFSFSWMNNSPDKLCGCDEFVDFPLAIASSTWL